MTVRTGRGRHALVEFEYRRGGTLAYLAAWDVHYANLFDRVEAKTGIDQFGRFVDDVMTTERYASARRVYWVVDNGSSHAGKRSIKRYAGRPRECPPDPPARTRLLAQSGRLLFSIVQRKALTLNDFADLDALTERLLVFGRR